MITNILKCLIYLNVNTLFEHSNTFFVTTKGHIRPPNEYNMSTIDGLIDHMSSLLIFKL